jgi:hypothetical protein
VYGPWITDALKTLPPSGNDALIAVSADVYSCSIAPPM